MSGFWSEWHSPLNDEARRVLKAVTADDFPKFDEQAYRLQVVDNGTNYEIEANTNVPGDFDSGG